MSVLQLPTPEPLSPLGGTSNTSPKSPARHVVGVRGCEPVLATAIQELSSIAASQERLLSPLACS